MPLQNNYGSINTLFVTQVVPEPSSLMLMGLGICSAPLVVAKRRRAVLIVSATRLVPRR